MAELDNGRSLPAAQLGWRAQGWNDSQEFYPIVKNSGLLSYNSQFGPREAPMRGIPLGESLLIAKGNTQ